MFERFTDRARRIVVLAQEEARMRNHNYIGTEHLLLGLIHEGEGVAARVLSDLGIGLDAVRQQVEEIIGAGAQEPTGHIPFTPRAKTVLQLSLREAMQLGHNYIGTEHLLLGLIREGDGVAAQVLVLLGADLNRVRQAVIGLLHGAQSTEREPARAPAAQTQAAQTSAAQPVEAQTAEAQTGEAQTGEARTGEARTGTQAAAAQESGQPWSQRFTDRARRAVILSQEEAWRLNHNYIGTEHILLGLVAEGDGVAVRALESMGISVETVRQQVEEIMGRGPQATSGHLPFTPRAKKVLELSLREALQLGHNYIGTEHLLLGLIRERDGVAAQVLVALGADLNRTRQHVIELLHARQEPVPASSGDTSMQADPPEFERFTDRSRLTDRSRRVLGLAQEEARRLNHTYAGSEHLLLGMLSEGEGVAGKTLESLGVSLDAARLEVEDIIGRGQQTPAGYVPFTPRARRIFDLSQQEATELGHAYVGTEHLLLALIREGEGVGAQVLIRLGIGRDLGIGLRLVRQQVIALLHGHSVAPPASPAGAELPGFDRFTNRARRVVVLTQEEAHDLSHDHIEPEHLLLGLLREGEESRAERANSSRSVNMDVNADASVATATLRFLGVDSTSLQERIKEEIGRDLPTAPTIGHIQFSDAAKTTLARAQRESLDDGYVGSQHILLGLADADTRTGRALAEGGASPERVREAVRVLLRHSEQGPINPRDVIEPEPHDPFHRYLSEEAHDPILGRSREIQQVIDALMPANAELPVLIGEHGVGLTFVIRGLAEAALGPDAPAWIAGKDVREVDVRTLMASSANWQQIGDRIVEVIADVRKLPDTIVFLRNAFNPAPLSGSSAQKTVKVTLALLAKGVPLVVSATPEEYQTYLSGQQTRPIREIWVGELPEAVATEILGELRDRVESRHQVTVPDQAIAAAVRLSAKHVRTRPLPVKAMDLIANAAAIAAGRNERGVIGEAEDKRAEARTRKEAAIDAQNFEVAAAHRETEREYEQLLPRLRQDWLNILTHPIVEVTEQDVVTALNVPVQPE